MGLLSQNLLKKKMFQTIKKYPIIKQIFIFGIIGVSNALIDFFVYILLTRSSSFWLKYYLIANTISFLIASIYSFFMNKKFSFKDTDNKNSFIKYIKFLTTTIISFFIVQLCLYISVQHLHVLDIYGKITGIILGAIWNFVIYKLVIFKQKQSIKINN